MVAERQTHKKREIEKRKLLISIMTKFWKLVNSNSQCWDQWCFNITFNDYGIQWIVRQLKNVNGPKLFN